MNLVWFEVKGTPVAQGSMVVQRGRIRHQGSDRLAGWRNDVAKACYEAMRSPDIKPQYRTYKPWAGAISLDLVFTYKPRRKADAEEHKVTSPDLDKLTRAVLDALTGVLYLDDRQVVALECQKAYGQWNDEGPEETSLSVNAKELA